VAACLYCQDCPATQDLSGRWKLPTKDFAELTKTPHLIEDNAYARNAKARAGQAVKAGPMSKAEEGKIDKKADVVLNKRRRLRRVAGFNATTYDR
jgi:hypothetical protein